jgi:hypothetical protein
MNQQINKKVIFKINNEVIGTLDADQESLCDVENLKCIIACEHNVTPEDIDVEYETEVIDLSDISISTSGKLVNKTHTIGNQEITGLDFSFWINTDSQEGMETILDYIKLGRVEELIQFNVIQSDNGTTF